MADYKVPVLTLASPPAKGDMIYFNGTDWVILPAGTVNPTNLLLNGDFENWSAGVAAAPDNWTFFEIGGTGGSIAREGTTKLIGSYSAKIVGYSGGSSGLYQDIHIEKGINYWKGKKITFGCWISWLAGVSPVDERSGVKSFGGRASGYPKAGS